MLAMLIWAVIGILAVLIVGGVLSWIVRTAPFVPEPMKAAVSWGIWVVVALIFLVWLVSAIPQHPIRF
jgi:hypothetical protein